MNRHRLLSSLSVLGLAGGVAAAASGCNSSSSSSGPGLGVDSMLFIKRQTTTVQNGQVVVDVAGGNGQVLDYQRYVPGGSLNILSPPRPDGTVTNLTAAYGSADFNGADVSFDATQAVFSMKKDGNDHYHVYTVDLVGGQHTIHQKTAGDYDDINPIYLPGGLIAFVTNEMYTAMGTRADEYEHSREALQLATISVDGGDADRHLFAQNLSHTVAPFLRSDGRIGYSQWEHFADVNDVKIRVVNPDGTQVLAVAGQHGKPVNSLFSVKELSPNVMIGIGTARDRTIHAGTLVKIDARNQNDPVCLDASQYAKGGTIGHACLDEENASYKVLTPEVPTGSDPSPAGRYREPSVLPDGRILVSWADGPVNDLNEQSLTPPDFGVWVYDTASGKNQLVYNDRATWDLNAVAITPRAEPPVIGSNVHTQDSTIAAVIGSVDISQTSLNETVDGAQFSNVPLSRALHDGAVAVRVIEGFSSEISTTSTPISMFGLTMFEGAAVLGEAPVYNDGSWLVKVPPFVPLHMQPIDKFGLAIRSQQLWMQTMPGESRRCVGCHESRTGQGVPAFGQNPTVAEQQLPMQQPFTEAIADRTEFPWDVKVQPILNSACTSCHNSSTTDYYTISQTNPVTGTTTLYKIPTLDLTDTPITVYYDRAVHTWPASYVSIFYPAALEMGLVKVVSGTVPPKWGIPGSARASALTQKLNLRAGDGSTAWPTSSNPLHPEDQGVQLTDDQRKTIAVYPMDLGGQYYARQNVGFMPYTAADPVNPSNATP
ncbi:MAG TPA: hypothetical protein VKU41_13880 [Polyangiaceae bacterium]|nr:hypothetical protein [Polyangiaceae bacterium]